MKEDKFDKIIRDRLYNHQMPVPENIWDKLETELQPVPTKKVPLFKRYRSIAAIAASFLFIGLISVYLTQQIEKTAQPVAGSVNKTEDKIVTPVEQITEEINPQTEIQSLTPVKKNQLKTLAVRTYKKETKAIETLSSAADTTPGIRYTGQSSDSVDSGNSDQQIQHPITREEADAKTRAFLQDGENARKTFTESNSALNNKKGTKTNNEMQLAVNFGNTGFANSLQKQPYATLRTKIDKDMVQFAQDMHPHSMGSRTNVKHHAPLAFGIMLSKELPLNFAVESGIRYTYMHSELKNPEETRKESQQLHYLGIPLSLKYRFWKWNNLNAYAKIGGAIDFNIAGTWKELYNYQADFGTGQISAFNEEIEKRPQLSVAGSLGIAYSLSDLFQLYFEPGVSYYFDNYTGVRNIRKEKPLDLSLQLGGRFSF